MRTKKLYAEDLPYYKTSNLGLDNSIHRIVKEITKAKGTVTGKAVVETEDRAYIFLEFRFDNSTLLKLSGKHWNQEKAMVKQH